MIDIVCAGGYFSAAGDDPSILLRAKEDYDGAEPAASSVAAANLFKLAALVSGEAGQRYGSLCPEKSHDDSPAWYQPAQAHTQSATMNTVMYAAANPLQVVARVWLKVKLILVCLRHACECMVITMLQCSAYVHYNHDLEVAASRERCTEQNIAKVSACTDT